MDNIIDSIGGDKGENGGDSLEPRSASHPLSGGITDTSDITGRNTTPAGGNNYNNPYLYTLPGGAYYTPIGGPDGVLDKGHLGLINSGGTADVPGGGPLYGTKFNDQRNMYGSDRLGAGGDKPYREILSSAAVVTGRAIPVSSKKDIAADEVTSVCNQTSYFYILDKDGNKPDAAANNFFALMNARAGQIFALCPDDGKVVLADPNKHWTNIKKSTTDVSKILAHTIEDGINGGNDFNEATDKHVVKLLILDPANTKENNEYFMEDFDSKIVDLSDQENILHGPTDGHQAIIQAAFMGHFISERYCAFGVKTFEDGHRLGIKRECEIIREMAKIKVEFETRSDPGSYVTGSIPFKTFYYPPNLPQAFVEVKIALKKENSIDYKNFVIGSDLIVNVPNGL